MCVIFFNIFHCRHPSVLLYAAVDHLPRLLCNVPLWDYTQFILLTLPLMGIQVGARTLAAVDMFAINIPEHVISCLCVRDYSL